MQSRHAVDSVCAEINYQRHVPTVLRPNMFKRRNEMQPTTATSGSVDQLIQACQVPGPLPAKINLTIPIPIQTPSPLLRRDDDTSQQPHAHGYAGGRVLAGRAVVK